MRWAIINICKWLSKSQGGIVAAASHLEMAFVGLLVRNGVLVVGKQLHVS